MTDPSSEEKRLPEPHDMQLPMSHWQRLRAPTFWEKHKLLPWIIFLGGITILLATIGLYAYRYYQRSLVKQPTTAQPTTSVPSPTITTIPTTAIPANWKTYEAKELGVSFKYPSEWNVDLTNGPTYIRVQNYDPKTAPGRSYSPTADKGKYLVVLRKDDTIKATNNAELQNFLANKALNNAALGPAIIANEKTFTVNGYTAYQREVSYPNSPMNNGLETYILDGKGNTVIVNPGLDVDGGKTYYDHILSTVQFTQPISPTAEGIEGKFCGGIAANIPAFQCPTGYYCKLDGTYPDAGGKCVKN